MRPLQKIALAFLLPMLAAAAMFTSSCSMHYGFRDFSVPDSIKVVKVNFIENGAPYVNPQLSQQLTDKLRQKIVSQTRLKQTSGDNADWEISGKITDYSFSTSGISNQQTTTNRITVAVHIILNKVKDGSVKEYDVSRNFDFSSTQTLQQAEASLLSEMVRGLTDDVFNRIFSEW